MRYLIVIGLKIYGSLNRNHHWFGPIATIESRNISFVDVTDWSASDLNYDNRSHETLGLWVLERFYGLFYDVPAN